MEPMYYIGLDVHKRTISYCVKDSGGKVYAEGSIPATRIDQDRWMKTLPQAWSAAMEATMFTGWIYDHLKPHAAALKVAHPLMLRAIGPAKKKNDRIDARTDAIASRVLLTGPETAHRRKCSVFNFDRIFAEVRAEPVASGVVASGVTVRQRGATAFRPPGRRANRKLWSVGQVGRVHVE